MPPFQVIVKRVLVLVAAFLAISLVFCVLYWLLLGGTIFAAYSYYFRLLTSEGEMNAWLARAVSLLLAVFVYLGLRLLFSIKKQQRTKGGVVILASFVAFYLLMYVCTRAAEQERRQAQQIANEEAARGAEEKARKEALERRFRETYTTDLGMLSQADLTRTVVLAIRVDGLGAQAGILRGHLAQLIEGRGKKPILTLFKPAFYDSGLFNDLWDGDKSVLQRLRLPEGGPGCFLLAKASFSDAEETDFEGFVAVQGTLSLLLITKDATKGPWVFSASGAGNNRVKARAHCAKRLAESIDVERILPE